MKQPWKERFGDFMAGKGFYIVLFLCVAAIGTSGYFLFSSLGSVEPDAPVAGQAHVVVTPSPTPSAPVQAVKPSVPPTAAPTPKSTPTPTPSATPAPTQEPTPTLVPTAAVYTWPVKGEIIRDFSTETLSFDHTLDEWNAHLGLDIAAEQGTKVRAAAGGTVSAVKETDLMGTTVTIDHGNGIVSTYSNLAEQPTVQVGDEVTTGDTIGSVGDTAIGESNLSSHLHFHLIKDGAEVDPLDYLPKVQ